MTKQCSILCLAGDGIGPEIMRSTIAVLEAVSPLMKRPLNLEHADIGFAALAKSGSTIPKEVTEKRAKQLASSWGQFRIMIILRARMVA